MTVVSEQILHGPPGPLSDENYMYALTNAYWVSRMASGLDLITLVETLDEAHEIAREYLGILIDPVTGLRSGIADEMRLRWRIASKAPRQQEGRDE